jgi:F-type H+-transporting ATPase subunit c
VAKKIVFMFFLIAFIALVQPAMAQDTGTGETNKWIAIACAFGLGFASAFCGIAQSIAFNAAANGVARNPGAADTIRGMLILGLAFIESLAIYVLLIAFMLYFKWA